MTRIASHRGGTLEFGDSTPRGFAATARMALEEVEFDVHPTRDGAIVVHHDPELNRTTDRTGAIAELTLAEVKDATIDYSEGGHPLTLAELCAIYRDSAVDFRCEIKPDRNGRPYSDFVPRVVETLRQEGMLERTGFTSFLIPSLDALAAATTRPRLWLVSPGVLYQLGVDGVIELAKAHGVAEISVNVDTASEELAATLRAAGIAFGVWAAHDVPKLEKAFRLGAKALTCDRPSLAIAVRARLAETAQ